MIMISMADEAAPNRMPTILTQGFRPLFLAAGLWSIVALVLWIAMLTIGFAVPSRFDPLTWHIHEMLFGFVMAAVGGFLLTAIPNWTQRLPVNGVPLAVLLALWLLGRAACLTSALLPAWLSITADLAFPAVLAAVAAREIVAGRNWRNLTMLAPIAVLGAANLLMHLEAEGIAIPAGLGWRLALFAILVLISVVGGRIIPSFTRNWLLKRNSAALPAGHDHFDRLALGILHAGMLGWAVFPDVRAFGAVLLLGAALHAWRLWRWRGRRTAAEPLLLILHVGYAWLALGAALLGLALLVPVIPISAAIHALTAGAIGTMILAVMTRATRGHSGRDLVADRPTIAIYSFVTCAALTRVTAAFLPNWADILYVAAAVLWVAAFGGFVLVYGPMLLGPRPEAPG
jgi:uncharacterized protein involved in response to NO